MAILKPSDASVSQTPRLGRPSVPTNAHHPFHDPDFHEEDAPLVPHDLAPGGQLNRELPRPAKTSLHITLELTESADKLLDEFRLKLPLIDQVMEEWIKMRGASPTTTGKVKLRELESHESCCDAQPGNVQYTNPAESDYTIGLARRLETPGRADVIYLAHSFENTNNDRTSSILENPKVFGSPDLDGLYVHIAEAHDESERGFAITEPVPALRISKSSARRTNSRPPNLRITDRPEAETVEHLPLNSYSPRPETAGRQADKWLGPFQQFWRHHADSYGVKMELDDDLPAKEH